MSIVDGVKADRYDVVRPGIFTSGFSDKADKTTIAVIDGVRGLTKRTI